MKEILLFNIIIFIFFERGDVREQCMKISGNSSPVDQHNYFKNKNNEQDTRHNTQRYIYTMITITDEYIPSSPEMKSLGSMQTIKGRLN
jgi:hypothetical protein